MALLSPRAFLGLDIGPTAIKLVELVDRGPRVDLSTYAVAPRPAGTALPELAAAISRLCERAQASSDVAVFSLPTKDVFSARLHLPALPDGQLSRAIRFQAGELIPAALTDVALSWFVRQQHRAAKDVYLTAVSKRLASQYQQLAGRLQLKIAALEPEALALLRAHDITTRQCTLVCDLQPLSVFCHLMDSGLPAASYTIEWDAAHPNAPSRLAAALARLLPVPRPTQTILAGTITPTAGLNEALHRVLLHEPHVSYPWYGLSYPPELESTLVELGPALAVAAGLARRPFPV